MFPDTSRNFSTSSGSTFLPFPNASQGKPALRMENRGNLKPTGMSLVYEAHRR